MKAVKTLLLFSSLIIADSFGYSYFKSSSQSKRIDVSTCYSIDGCLNLNQKVSINTGLNQKVPIGYLLSILSNEIKYPIIVRCGDAENKCVNVKVSYYADKKPLLQVLKEISALTGLYVKITPEGIVFYKYEEATFDIPLPPIVKDITIEDKGNDKESFLVQYKRDYLGKLEEKLKALIQSKYGEVSVSEKGYVFVRGTHQEVKAVEQALEKIRRNLNRPIKLKVNIYLVDVSNGNENGINWNWLAKTKDYLNFSFTGLATFGSQNYISINAKGTRVNALLEAMASKGNVKLLSSNEFRVLNTQPLYFAPQTKERIISKFNLTYIAVEGTTNTGATTQPTLSVQTEDINTGEKLLLVPYYLNKNTIALDFVRKYSQLDSLIEKTINLQGFQNQIALPKITSLIQSGQAVLKKGDTLVLISNEMTLKQIKKEGIPFLQDIPFLGHLFSYTKENNRKMRVLITISFEGE